MVTKEDDKHAFAARLIAMLDAANVAKIGDGRQGVLAKMFNISGNAARKWLNGESIPRYERILKLVDKYKETGATVEWLVTGNPDYAPAWATTDKNPNQNYTNHLNEPVIKGEVPLVSFAQVGAWSETSFNLRPTDGESMVKTREAVSSRAFALTVPGDSMEHEFAKGDWIIVDPGVGYAHEDYVIARKGSDVIFRQIIKEGADWLLKPENKRYDNIPLGDYQIVGVVVEKSKSYKKR